MRFRLRFLALLPSFESLLDHDELNTEAQRHRGSSAGLGEVVVMTLGRVLPIVASLNDHALDARTDGGAEEVDEEAGLDSAEP